MSGIRMNPPPEQVDRSHWLCKNQNLIIQYKIIYQILMIDHRPPKGGGAPFHTR